MRRGPVAAALLAAPVAAAPLRAQPAPAAPPDSGATVRVVLEDRSRVEGTLVARDPGRWLVVRGRRDTVAVVPARIARLDVSRGRRTVGQAFWRGAGVGALVGAGTTYLVAAATAVGGGLDCDGCMFSPGLLIAVGGTTFTIATSVVGGVVGSGMRERWTRVAVPAEARLGLVATPRGPGIALHLALP